MATTTGTWANFFDSFKEYMGDGTIDMDADSFGCLLIDNTTEPSISADVFVSDLPATELSGSGYARDTTLGATWTKNGSTTEFDITDATFTAAGGNLVARWWVLYSNTNGTDATRELVAYGLLDNTPADVTTTDGNTLTIQWGAPAFTLS